MSLGQAARHLADDAPSPAGSLSDPAGMRVLLLNYEYPPLGGGAGVATEAIARRLAARGFQVDVVTAGAQTHARVARRTERLGTADGRLSVLRVRSCRVGLHEASMRDAAGYLRAALPLIRRLTARQHYDVVHCFFSLPTGALLGFAGLGDTPVVVSLRGSDVPGYDPHNRLLQAAHRGLLPLTRRIWRRAGRVVALSDSLGRLAAKSDASLAYSVIRNGVDLELFHPPETPRPLRTDRVRCLAVARLVERKGLDDLLHAIAAQERGRFELEIVGTGHDEARLRNLACALSLGNEVRFLGALDRAAVAERYRAADLFTLASWEESFGNVFAEALASGLPIVGTRTGGIPEFITDGVHGVLVPPRDPVALADALHRLAGDLVTRARMRARNRMDAELTLSWDRVTDAYIDVYAQAR